MNFENRSSILIITISTDPNSNGIIGSNKYPQISVFPNTSLFDIYLYTDGYIILPKNICNTDPNFYEMESTYSTEDRTTFCSSILNSGWPFPYKRWAVCTYTQEYTMELKKEADLPKLGYQGLPAAAKLKNMHGTHKFPQKSF